MVVGAGGRHERDKHIDWTRLESPVIGHGMHKLRPQPLKEKAEVAAAFRGGQARPSHRTTWEPMWTCVVVATPLCGVSLCVCPLLQAKHCTWVCPNVFYYRRSR